MIKKEMWLKVMNEQLILCPLVDYTLYSTLMIFGFLNYRHVGLIEKNLELLFHNWKPCSSNLLRGQTDWKLKQQKIKGSMVEGHLSAYCKSFPTCIGNWFFYSFGAENNAFFLVILEEPTVFALTALIMFLILLGIIQMRKAYCSHFPWIFFPSWWQAFAVSF